MRFLLSVVLIAIFSLTSNAQYKIEGTIEAYLNKKLVLLEYFGDKHIFVDSTQTNGQGWFSFEMDEKDPAGLYSLAIGKTPLFNLIYNHENVSLKFEAGKSALPEFIFSIENLIYYDYLVQSQKYSRKAGQVVDILRFYPETDSFYHYTEDYFQSLQLEFRAYSRRIIREYPGMYVTGIISSDKPVMIPEEMNWNEYIAFMQSHYLDETDFSDTSLLNSNVFTGKAIDYLGFYTLNNGNKELQEQVFIQAVDTILNKAIVNGKVYNFIMQYLIEGFDMYGFDHVISYIAENYEPAGTCVDEDRKSELEKRMENLRRLAVGNIAPDIIIEGILGNKTRLADINKDLTVIMFWASWCPHCNSMIPGLKELYHAPGLPEFEILAISIDTSASDYNMALSMNTTPWINYTEFKGWNSTAAEDYSIYATPTMFLLDRNRKILARPVSVYDLKIALGKLGGGL